MEVKSVSIRLATLDDKHLPAYDNTKLQAVNTCPTWGVLRYQMHKVFNNSSRAMALECGSAMHEMFAAVRLWQLWKYDAPKALSDPDSVCDLAYYHGRRLFGQDRFAEMIDVINIKEDQRTQCLNFCLQALYNSGYYDDPSDRRRTMSNMEEAAIMYIDRWDFNRHPIWIRDPSDPKSDVGIEIAFDVVVTYTFVDDTVRHYRFVGKFDGIHTRDGDLIIGENKTASRLDEAWSMSFEMSSQVTGYMLAASAWAEQPCSKAVIWGISIPLPKTYDNGGLRVEVVRRASHMFANWFDWFLYSIEQYERYSQNPIAAPRFTHSCNRYFRPCSFIPFCTAPEDEQRLIVSEMYDEEWSPLHDAKAGD